MSIDVYLATDTGTRTALLDNFVSLDYTLIENDASPATIVLPAQRYDEDDFQRDYRLEIEVDGQPEYGSPFLIRAVEKTLSDRGEKLLIISGYSPVHLLARRWIAYYAGSSGALKTDNPEDIMEALVDENIGANSQVGDRDVHPASWSSYFEIESITGTLTSTTKAMSRRPLLTTLQELANEAWQATGTWLGFDVVWTTDSMFRFKVFTGQRGTNRGAGSANVATFSPEFGNMVNISRLRDWRNEITVAIAAGQDSGASRNVEVIEDDRKDDSEFNWIEQVVDARHVSTSAALQAEAREALRAGRPRDVFVASILDTPAMKRKTDWDWGDIVSAMFEGDAFDARMSVLRVSVTKGGLVSLEAGLKV